MTQAISLFLHYFKFKVKWQYVISVWCLNL
jgi:hypothetical protein